MDVSTTWTYGACLSFPQQTFIKLVVRKISFSNSSIDDVLPFVPNKSKLKEDAV